MLSGLLYNSHKWATFCENMRKQFSTMLCIIRIASYLVFY